MSGLDHLDDITITINLDSAPISRQGFSTVLLLVDEAEGTGNGLGGDRFRTYTTVAAAQTDQTGGDITAAVLQAVTDGLSQRPRPTQIHVGRVDTVGAETYATALPLVITAGADFYGVVADTRTTSEQLALAAVVETLEKFYIIQNPDADWKTTGIPAAWSGAAAYENSAVLYHDTAAEWSDLCWAMKWLVFDPDSKSAPGIHALSSVTAYATALTDAEKAFVKANCNAGLVLDPAPFFVSPGENFNSRPIYEVLTAHWFATRIREDVAALLVRLSNRGEKLPVNADGQRRVGGIVFGRMEQGVRAGHFQPGEIEVTYPLVTAADRTARVVKVDGRAQFLVGATSIQFTGNFSTDALADA